MQRILYAASATEYKVFLSGNDNFRYAINPEYKANRKDVPRPEWLQPVREYLVVNHKAIICDGVEADDELGIHQDKENNTTIIASIDKDLLMIPGLHYNFVKDEHSTVTKLEGLRHFYIQLILGDKADNIFGYDGKARSVIPIFLQPAIDYILACEYEQDMYEYVADMYDDMDRLIMNAHCLYIRQKTDDKWKVPTA